jgi:alkylation response protein AidB-like acyl-CoA dehydrogenase
VDFAVSDKTKALVAEVRRFLEAEVYPLERGLAAGRFRALLPALAAARARVRALGLFAPPLPPEWGGMGLSLLEFAHVAEALGRTPLGHYVFNCQAPDIGNMELLLRHGSEAQKARFLAPLARGEIRSCFSMVEPDFPGSNPTWMATSARREGAGYAIEGRKWFTSAADGAAFAVVMAITNPEQERHFRASLLIVPCDTPGFEIVRNIPVMGEPGEDYASHAEVRYRGCRVPEENRIGPEGAGFALAQERLGPGRIHHCMRWIGIAERAFDLLCARACSREIAPGKPLGTRGPVREWIAESRAEIDAARLLVLEAAWKIDREGAPAAREQISLIKFFVAGVMQRALDRAIQAHGAAGLTDETPLAYWWRHERAARIYDGPDEVHKESVAKRILARYGLEEGRPPRRAGAAGGPSAASPEVE